MRFGLFDSYLERMKFQERHRAVVANNQILELIRYYFEHQQEVAGDLGLPTGYSLDHVGSLIYGDLESAQTLLRQHDLKVRRQFPSVVLAKILSEKYQRPVELTILKTENPELCYEIFCLTNGALTEAEMRTEIQPSFHIAFRARDGQRLALPAPWELLTSGVNPHEGSRMAYFSNRKTKLELISFLPDPAPPSAAAA